MAAAGQHAWNAVGEKRMPVRGIDGVRRADHKNQNGGDLDEHHHVVRGRALAHAAHQHPRQDQQNQQRQSD